MISGTTKLIAHLGHPTESFRAPMIYNPYFTRRGIDAVVVPMGVKAPDFPTFLKVFARLSNAHGALITMPHKVTAIGLVDEVMTTAAIAGACNAVRVESDGRLVAEMFDGEGFVRGVLKKGRAIVGARALIIGAGGVGSAIAASLAKAGVSEVALSDTQLPTAIALGERLRRHYPALVVSIGGNDPEGFDIIINATPLGMRAGDPLPVDVARIAPSAFVGEVVMKQDITPFLEAVRARGCAYQVGIDMLFEQIPAYLEFFGFPTTTSDDLRAVAHLAREEASS
ncbi:MULTISPECIES: shikimate dehydrogenase [unclassified Chelatococcus]|uniref:shikimate dehydrogenase family protein n=1 Tax=unclassified Chelatococcus TaxID=2638111 RepID=UPI001BCC69AB|nr:MULTISPECIES: shikimate dehydrogenase [unclassified Chelatococcus]CAH1651968.1 Shikimate 5-dehydrogenase I alpha [Hyphomicrobiales bacterium]MBS7743096.1 shikimate dehydrogenase [Chelatococcus sp. HY11]MBX3541786.1 shikimate dehydrogenase [Chelatococcus sp.]MCO5074322.1 shikimate dehydrogenase [Chelatococcus sp.]CAH1693580.1 Shikimate 5-dehydrogenase I alpha [Hyphomicrobiales bacterium]